MTGEEAEREADTSQSKAVLYCVAIKRCLDYVTRTHRGVERDVSVGLFVFECMEGALLEPEWAREVLATIRKVTGVSEAPNVRDSVEAMVEELERVSG